jgi:hypothetical protein
MRVAVELRETLDLLLQVSPADSPVLHRLIASYRDIARELGQQSEVEHTLRDVLPRQLATVTDDAYAGAPANIHSPRTM